MVDRDDRAALDGRRDEDGGAGSEHRGAGDDDGDRWGCSRGRPDGSGLWRAAGEADGGRRLGLLRTAVLVPALSAALALAAIAGGSGLASRSGAAAALAAPAAAAVSTPATATTTATAGGAHGASDGAGGIGDIGDKGAPAHLSRAEVPAAGRQVAILGVERFGRYSVRAASRAGTSVRVVDRMAGEAGGGGGARPAEGRLDPLLVPG